MHNVPPKEAAITPPHQQRGDGDTMALGYATHARLRQAALGLPRLGYARERQSRLGWASPQARLRPQTRRQKKRTLFLFAIVRIFASASLSVRAGSRSSGCFQPPPPKNDTKSRAAKNRRRKQESQEAAGARRDKKERVTFGGVANRGPRREA